MHESVVKVRKVFTLHLSEVDQNDPVGVRQLDESSSVDNFCVTVCIFNSPFHVESKGPAKRAQYPYPQPTQEYTPLQLRNQLVRFLFIPCIGQLGYRLKVSVVEHGGWMSKTVRGNEREKNNF